MSIKKHQISRRINYSLRSNTWVNNSKKISSKWRLLLRSNKRNWNQRWSLIKKKLISTLSRGNQSPLRGIKSKQESKLQEINSLTYLIDKDKVILVQVCLLWTLHKIMIDPWHLMDQRDKTEYKTNIKCKWHHKLNSLLTNLLIKVCQS